MAPSMMDRDSGVLATTSIDVYQPIVIEEPPPPSPGISFGGMYRDLRSSLLAANVAGTPKRQNCMKKGEEVL